MCARVLEVAAQGSVCASLEGMHGQSARETCPVVSKVTLPDTRATYTSVERPSGRKFPATGNPLSVLSQAARKGDPKVDRPRRPFNVLPVFRPSSACLLHVDPGKAETIESQLQLISVGTNEEEKEK